MSGTGIRYTTMNCWVSAMLQLLARDLHFKNFIGVLSSEIKNNNIIVDIYVKLIFELEKILTELTNNKKRQISIGSLVSLILNMNENIHVLHSFDPKSKVHKQTEHPIQFKQYVFDIINLVIKKHKLSKDVVIKWTNQYIILHCVSYCEICNTIKSQALRSKIALDAKYDDVDGRIDECIEPAFNPDKENKKCKKCKKSTTHIKKLIFDQSPSMLYIERVLKTGSLKDGNRQTEVSV